MTLQETSRWGRGPCYEGEINGYSVLVLATEHPSQTGLGGGKIDQLYIGIYGTFVGKDNLLMYRREWFGPPPVDRKLRQVVEQAVRQIDHKDVDWAAERRRYEQGFRG